MELLVLPKSGRSPSIPDPAARPVSLGLPMPARAPLEAATGQRSVDDRSWKATPLPFCSPTGMVPVCRATISVSTETAGGRFRGAGLAHSHGADLWVSDTGRPRFPVARRCPMWLIPPMQAARVRGTLRDGCSPTSNLRSGQVPERGQLQGLWIGMQLVVEISVRGNNVRREWWKLSGSERLRFGFVGLAIMPAAIKFLLARTDGQQIELPHPVLGGRAPVGARTGWDRSARRLDYHGLWMTRGV